MTDDEVDEYVSYLHAHLPPEHRIGVEQVRAILDAETAYFEQRFGSLHGWRALLLSVLGRGQPSPERIAAEQPAFEEYVVRTVGIGGTLTREDVRAVMRVEDEVGPTWPPAAPSEPESGEATGDEREETY